jgi:hypothetical protein
MITEILAKLVKNQTTSTTAVTNRAVKFPVQSPFSGKPDQLEPTIQEAELRFSINDHKFNTPTKKAYYLLSLFTEGSAKLWKEQYILPRQNKSLCEADQWEEFKNTLQANFSDIGSKDDALQKLQNMRQQPKQHVDEFNTRFRILAQKAGLQSEVVKWATEAQKACISIPLQPRIDLNSQKGRPGHEEEGIDKW